MNNGVAQRQSLIAIEENRSDSGPRERTIKVRTLGLAAIVMAVVYFALRLSNGQGTRDVFILDGVSFVLSLLSTAVVAWAASYVYGSDLETLRADLRKLSSAINKGRSGSSVCIIAPSSLFANSSLFEEVKQVVKAH